MKKDNIIYGSDLEEDKDIFPELYKEIKTQLDKANIPINFAHLVKDSHLGEFISDKWKELYIKDEWEWDNVEFVVFIDWEEVIETAKTNYVKVYINGDVYWANI